MNRRSLKQVLIGVIAAMVGMASTTVLRISHCTDGGGRWVPDRQICLGPDGAPKPNAMSEAVAGLGVALLTALVLHRISTFAARRRSGSAA
jgi:hypothetical protein